MIKRFSNVRISGMSLVVPEREISIYDELQYYGNSEKKAERAHKMAGFWKRRVADSDMTATDLGVQAAENLIAAMKLDKSKIEAMLLVIQQPDYNGPCTSYSAHHRLGLSKNCYVSDIVQGCVGWCFGLLTAAQMVAGGTYKSVLIVNCDTPAKSLDPSDRINAPLFGDAGLATLVEFSEGAPEITFDLDTYSEGYDAIISCRPHHGRLGLDIRKREDWELLTEHFETANGRFACLAEGYMDGPAVFEFSTQKAPANIRELMAELGTTPENYDQLSLHQANKQIIQTVGANAGFPLDKVPFACFENFGNNTMCSIPSTILLSLKDKILGDGARCLCCGFGNGLVVCSIDLHLAHMKCAEINVYKKPSDHKTAAEWRQYWREKFINT